MQLERAFDVCTKSIVCYFTDRVCMYRKFERFTANASRLACETRSFVCIDKQENNFVLEIVLDGYISL